MRAGLTLRLALAAAIAVSTAALCAPSSQPAGGEVGPALTADDVAALKEVRALLKDLAVDARETPQNRRAALEGLCRVHEALNDWGDEQQTQWYRDLLLAHLKDPNVEILADLAQSHAKAGLHHLGGVRGFWRAIVDPSARNDLATRAWQTFENKAKSLGRKIAFPAMPKPMMLTAKKLDLSKSLKPLGLSVPAVKPPVVKPDDTPPPSPPKTRGGKKAASQGTQEP